MDVWIKLHARKVSRLCNFEKTWLARKINRSAYD